MTTMLLASDTITIEIDPRSLVVGFFLGALIVSLIFVSFKQSDELDYHK